MTQPDLSLSLPYVTPELPGVGGVLRVTPEHFVVTEIPLYEPEGEGNHLFINLTRANRTTRDVVVALERIGSAGKGSVGYAGLKDKAARTTQTFSLPVRAGFSEDDIAEFSARVQEGLSTEAGEVNVNWAHLNSGKLKVGHLLGNRFQIILTNPMPSPEEALTRTQAIAARIARIGVPNYLGPQRFGAQGNNAQAGYEVLQRRRRVQDKWMRKFYITSYQSHLCNLYLARRVEMGAFAYLLEGDVAKKHQTGGVFLVEDAEVEQPRFEAQEISFTAPMFGFKMMRAQSDAGALEAEIEAETGITDTQWRDTHTEGTRRMGRLIMPDLQLHTHADGLLFEFSLPKGGFATTILREFMKDEGDSSLVQEIDE